jgi:hypothetical protein
MTYSIYVSIPLELVPCSYLSTHLEPPQRKLKNELLRTSRGARISNEIDTRLAQGAKGSQEARRRCGAIESGKGPRPKAEGQSL